MVTKATLYYITKSLPVFFMENYLLSARWQTQWKQTLARSCYSDAAERLSINTQC